MKSAVFTYQKRESTIDFEGRIALVLFTQGCNFRCRYCHNPELVPVKNGGTNMTFEELGSVLGKAGENWIDGVCITGGEPTMQKTLPETLSFIRQKGMDIKLDTQGSFPEMLGKVIEYCDYIAMDYKTSLDKYPSVTGVETDRRKILESLEVLRKSGIEYEIRTTIIPGIHTEEDIKQICSELSGIKKFVLQAFIPRENLPDRELVSAERTPNAMLEQFAELCNGCFEKIIVR